MRRRRIITSSFVSFKHIFDIEKLNKMNIPTNHHRMHAFMKTCRQPHGNERIWYSINIIHNTLHVKNNQTAPKL